MRRKVRKKVSIRDKCSCFICCRGKKLQVHHICDKTNYPLLIFVESNLITLCRERHGNFHYKFMGSTMASCDDDDWEDFNYIVDYYKGLFSGSIIHTD